MAASTDSEAQWARVRLEHAEQDGIRVKPEEEKPDVDGVPEKDGKPEDDEEEFAGMNLALPICPARRGYHRPHAKIYGECRKAKAPVYANQLLGEPGRAEAVHLAGLDHAEDEVLPE